MSDSLERYRFLMALLIDRGVLTNTRYPNGVWSLQGIYGIDDSGLRGAGTTPEEAIDNAIAAARLDPADKLTHWRETHETLKRNADAEEGTLGFAALSSSQQREPQEAVISYPVLHEYARDNHLSFNELCRVVRGSLLSAPQEAAQHREERLELAKAMLKRYGHAARNIGFDAASRKEHEDAAEDIVRAIVDGIDLGGKQ